MPPTVRIEVVDCRLAGDQADRWRVRWLVHNLADEPLALHSAWVPHGRFRGDGRLALDARLPAHAASPLELMVTAAGKPGEVVHNAFLILQVTASAESWRIFTRMRIEFTADGELRPVVELVTNQPTGTS